MWSALAARPASCSFWWTPPASAPYCAARGVPTCPAICRWRGFDCLYVNYPGTAIISYMRQMLGKSFVVAQYPKGGQARRPCHVLVASRSDLGEVSDPWQHARQLAGSSSNGWC